MMKKFYLITIVLLLLTISWPALAQQTVGEIEEIDGEEVQEVIDPALKLKLYHDGKQNFPDKSFEITIEIDSLIDSGKVGIDWTYPSDLLAVEGPKIDIVTVTSNQKFVLTKKFTPKIGAVLIDTPERTRRGEFGVRVNAFVPERNYLSSTSMKLDFNNQMEILPIDPDYAQSKKFNNILNISIKIAVVAGVLGLIGFAIKRFLDYINSEDEERF